MSHPDTERDGRLKQIRERLDNHPPEQPIPLQILHDAIYLLSLYDSQVGDYDKGAQWGIDHAQSEYLRGRLDATTRMRSHCIETVKEYWQRIVGEDDEGMRELLFGALVVELENLKLEGDNSRTKPQPDSIATRTRDRCVDAIKSLRATPRGAAYNNAVNDAIHKVESLTLEGEQEKSK